MFFIDRIEENKAVIFDEDKYLCTVDKNEIKGNARDGAVVVKDNKNWVVDEAAAAERLEKMRKRLDRLFGKDK